MQDFPVGRGRNQKTKEIRFILYDHNYTEPMNKWVESIQIWCVFVYHNLLQCERGNFWMENENRNWN